MSIVRSMAFPLVAFPLAALLAGCSTAQENRNLDQKLAQAHDAGSGTQIAAEAQRLSRSAPNLSPEQRAKLGEIERKTRQRLSANRDESLKVRSILLRELLSPTPDPAGVAAAEARLKKLSKERLDTLFSAADETNQAIGRDELMRQAMDVQFIQDDFNFW